MSEKKARRGNGDGCLYRHGRFYWMAYKGPDGRRIHESTLTDNKSEALEELQKRTGQVKNYLPVVPNSGRLTCREALNNVIADFRVNGKKSLRVVEGRTTKHLLPYFGHRRAASITTADVRSYVLHRQEQGVVNRKDKRVRDVANAQINRELQILKRAFNLARREGRLGSVPYIAMLKESAPRTGFFEPAQFASVYKHLPEELQPVAEFLYITGWRKSEVLGLEWRQVNFERGEVTLDPGTTKNGEGRTFMMTAALRTLLEEQDRRRKETGRIVLWVFFRMVGRRGGRAEKQPHPILSFDKAFHRACTLAGCPGRILHDFRRTAVRNLDRAGVPRSVAMRMVGHRTEAIYRRYRIVDEQDLRDAAARLDAVAGRG